MVTEVSKDKRITKALDSLERGCGKLGLTVDPRKNISDDPLAAKEIDSLILRVLKRLRANGVEECLTVLAQEMVEWVKGKPFEVEDEGTWARIAVAIRLFESWQIASGYRQAKERLDTKSPPDEEGFVLYEVSRGLDTDEKRIEFYGAELGKRSLLARRPEP